ncbi:LAME_0H11760g1_1 [Lachancea meyersii CBS 8951]|uniref:Mediator of RNA polymerase II transcription subunit 13 n=1 Tax=Lachancea meyersii CBS 8951 TaxID=1266667 RepID=A0A1G4KGG3_9SACH|nr:LAME_0H11760g1_1 [Lachancea meyersii CBS 8951]
MEHGELPYRLEELLTSFYRLETVERINYVQYIPSKSDAQWSIQTELALRKQDSKVLTSLFSRELWCFSINQAPIPSLELGHSGTPPAPEKTGYFTPDFSKPNLPTAYAVFLKALRRMIHINLCLDSKQHLVPFGNSCLLKNSDPEFNKLVHFEPQLFENGDLCVSVCSKEMRLRSLDMTMITESHFRKNAIYLAPSGIRAYLASSDVNNCVSPAPRNASVLLITLLVSHGIDLTNRKDLTWVRVSPNLDHLNGYTPCIAGYLDPPKSTKTAIWPLELCFSQSCLEPVSTRQNLILHPNLQDTFDMIDDFIHLKLTSAFRTPGSISGGPGSGTITGNNTLSTGGIYADQYPAFHRHTQSGSLAALGVFNNSATSRLSPGTFITNVTPVNSRSAPHSVENLSFGYLTTPNINENIDTTIDDVILSESPRKVASAAWDGGVKESEERAFMESTSNDAKSATSTSHTDEDGSDLEAELFGDVKDGEENNSPRSGMTEPGYHVKEITDEMLEIADDSDHSKERSTHMKDPSPFNIGESPFKRKYLDIPLDEITLPNTPLYTDPGAPLPIETPKDRRKSVFAPLNFNPIIESNVDNKYKNGGKFSLDGSKLEESLKFDVSTANMSSSEDEDSGSDVEEYGNLIGGTAPPALEGNPVIMNFPVESQPQTSLDVVQGYVFKDSIPFQRSENDVGDERDMLVNHSDTWKKGGSLDNFDPQTSQLPLGGSKTGHLSSNSEPADDLMKLATNTPFSDKASKSPAPTYFSDTSSDGIELKENGEVLYSDSPAAPETSNSLPFLLRHMPLFSMPDVFFCKNPRLRKKDNLNTILDLLSDQIIFDNGILNNLGTEPVTYGKFIGCSEGTIKKTMETTFSKFERVNGGEIIEDINYIPQPAVHLKKNDELIKMKADAELFSSHLCLRPYKGTKNFKTLFLTTKLKNDCFDFLSTMSQIYSSEELGFCELVKLTFADTPGLVYLVNFEKDTLLLLSAQIVSYCSTNTINTMPVPLLVFLPLLGNDISDVVSLTLKFEFLAKEVTSKLPNVKMFLKLIPLDFLKNPLTSVDDYYKLCVGIYNSIPPKGTKFSAVAEEIPKKIEFRAGQQTNGQISHFDVYVHLAYARSIDRNWICAAWSNSRGSESGVKTWYIGNSTSAFEEACSQMWQITSQIVANNYGRICLVLTRFDSILPDDELMHWRRLSSTSRNLHLAVVCVGDDTKLSLYDEDRFYPSFKPIFENDKLSQAIDTANLDNYEIVNIENEVHGVLFQNPLQLANSQHRCGIRTGALVRFKASSSRNILDKFEVNLLNCPHSDSTKLLKIILQEFRNLAALNSWFGVSDSRHSFVPWHVLAVKKMINAIVHLQVSNKD